MNIRKIEGSAWHFLAESMENHKDNMDGTQFSQQLALHKADKQKTEHYQSPLPVISNRQRYRVIGGIADGLVIDIHEQRGTIDMSVCVHDKVLFTVLHQIAHNLIDQLQHGGFKINLEIKHVDYPA